jgi:hypothetical protein
VSYFRCGHYGALSITRKKSFSFIADFIILDIFALANPLFINARKK